MPAGFYGVEVLRLRNDYADVSCERSRPFVTTYQVGPACFGATFIVGHEYGPTSAVT